MIYKMTKWCKLRINCDCFYALHCPDGIICSLPYRHSFYVPSEVCHLLCNLHRISIKMPAGPEVTQGVKRNLFIERITAHIQHIEDYILWRDYLTGLSLDFLNWLHRKVKKKGEYVCRNVYV